MADPKSRELARDYLATLLDTELVSTTPQIAMAVFNHHPNDFSDSGSPAVLVLSSGIARPKAGVGSQQYRAMVRLEVLTFVPRAGKSSTWGPDDIEDRLDELERRIAKVVAEHQSEPGYWTNIWYQEGAYSDIFPSNLGGEPFMSERIFLEVRLEK